MSNCKLCSRPIEEFPPSVCGGCIENLDEKLVRMVEQIQRAILMGHWDDPILRADRLREYMRLAEYTGSQAIQMICMGIIRTYLIYSRNRAGGEI